MVVNQCPHCEEDVEFKEGVFGLFDCPNCGEEFSYEDDELYVPSLFHRLQIFMTTGMKIGLGIIGIGAIVFMGFKIDEGPSCSEFGCGMWVFIPCGIWAIGIPMVVISFMRSGWQSHWEI
tara:strand:+ start:352 stop:711 length:360 start_codon:yes stop_codon:yes gene_type:complete